MGESTNIFDKVRNDPLFKEFILNNITNRVKLSRALSPEADERRNLYSECGYPLDPIDPTYYYDLYMRDAIAARVVEIQPKECWQVQPEVYEVADNKKLTRFEAAVNKLSSNLSPTRTWYKQQASSRLWTKLAELDIKSRIGHFGVMLIGADDNNDFSQPAFGTDSNETGALLNTLIANEMPSTVKDANPDIKPLTSRDEYKPTTNINYLKVFPESQVKVIQTESNPNSPRYGHPIRYTIQMSDLRHGTISSPNQSLTVHWTRIIHVAEGDGVYGIPALKQVLNHVLNLQKIYGASGEGCYQSSFAGLAFITHPTLDPTAVEVDESKLKDMAEAYIHGFQRVLYLLGMDVKQLAPMVIDPSPHIDKQLQAITIKLGVPISVFMGSERGERSSSQDDASHNDRIRQRQREHDTPVIICQTIDRFIALGALPEPETGEYIVNWPDLDSVTKSQQAQISLTVTRALSEFIKGRVHEVLAPLDYLVDILGYSQEEAKNKMEAVKEYLVEFQQQLLEKAKTFQSAGLDPMGNPLPPPPVIGGKPGTPSTPGKTRGPGKGAKGVRRIDTDKGTASKEEDESERADSSYRASK
jgi:hypothetical protein